VSNSSKLKDEIWQQRKRVVAVREQYITQLYLETMPAYDPMYKYCYSTSNMQIPAQLQSVECWLRAVMQHMNARHTGHGGAASSAVIVTVPKMKSDAEINKWLDYQQDQLRARARKIMQRTVNKKA
jgi:hypothetical protein